MRPAAENPDENRSRYEIRNVNKEEMPVIGALEAGGIQNGLLDRHPQGGVLQRASFPTLTPETTVPQIVEFIGKFDVAALGIGSFGPLDLNPQSPTYGSITASPKTEWCNYPLLRVLKEELGVPAAIDTDVNAAALAGIQNGGRHGPEQPALCDGGHLGIGGGLVIGGQMVHGLVHPELGHMILSPLESDPMPDGICPFHPALPGRAGLRAGD